MESKLIIPKKKKGLSRKDWKWIAPSMVLVPLAAAFLSSSISFYILRRKDIRENGIKSVDPIEIQDSYIPVPDFEPLKSYVKLSDLPWEDIAWNCAGPVRLESEYMDRIDATRIKEIVQHPIQSRIALRNYQWRNNKGDGEMDYSFKSIHDGKIQIDCSGSAIASATMLEDDGIEPFILLMAQKEHSYFEALMKKSKPGHAVHLYKSDGRFGYIGVNNITAPKFDSVEGVVRYISNKGCNEYDRYLIYDLRSEKEDWRTTTNNIMDILPKYIELGEK